MNKKKTFTKQLTLRPEEEASRLANSAAGSAALLSITSPATLEKAIGYLSTIADVRKQVEAKRVELVKPLNEHVKRINEMFRPALKNLEDADGALRFKVLAYRSVEQKKADAERAALLKDAIKAQKKGDDDKAADIAASALAVVQPARLMTAGVGLDGGHTSQVATRKTWSFAVEDIGCVPDEFWTLDESKIRSAVRAGTRKIPGVRIFETESLAVGGR